MYKDEEYMKRCLELAENGKALVAPNPMVGAVIVCDGQIIGEGFHQQFGGDHAEVAAIKSLKDNFLPENSTMYVNLEPCSHQGKTPPCCDLLIDRNISRVIIGCVDSNKAVSGSGIERLKKAGIEVKTGVLEKECRHLNRRFYTFHEKQRPYIILKWAQSKDGFFAPSTNKQQWITGKLSRKLVHKWRTEELSILVGTKTAIIDNPELTARLWSGKNPLRLLLDRKLKVPTTHHLYDESSPTLIFNQFKEEKKGANSFITLDFNTRVFSQILKHLHQLEITSIIVEGGKELLQGIIDSEIWDEARIFTGELSMEAGMEAPVIKTVNPDIQKIGSDVLTTSLNPKAI